MIDGVNIPGVSNEAELYVAPGRPLFRLTARIGITRQGQVSLVRRIMVLILITWVPMCALAFLEGCALGSTPRGSFLLDYAAYARFFVAVPLLVIADEFIGPQLAEAGLHFVRDGLVGPSDYPAFEQAITRLARRRESIAATLILIALAECGAWTLTFETVRAEAMNGWQSVTLVAGHLRSSLAGIWYHIVAVPIFLFLLYRWLWRILIWTLFLRDVSRMNLQLIPTHADQAGGLGYLSISHACFSILAFGISCVPSAEGAFRIVYEGARLSSFQVLVVVLIVVAELLFLGPLFVFSPALFRAKRDGLLAYGALIDRYNRSFHDKWIERKAPEHEPLLGSADIQSLADMGNSFRFVSDMRFTPFNLREVILLAAAAALPCFPLLLLVMPFSEILNALAKMAL